MNKKQRDEMSELILAEETERVLESGDCINRDETSMFELGRLLRRSVDHGLPESSEVLRTQLLTELEGEWSAEKVSTKTPAREAFSGFGRKRLWMSIAAATMVAAGGWWLYQPNLGFGVNHSGQAEMVGQLDLVKTEPAKTATEDAAGPKVVYKMETVTTQVPTTKTRVETRTRAVPVNKTRKEKRKVQAADGTWELKEVEVPYTANVTQNYAVSVPYTESVTQTLQKKVPYTPDGKRIEAADYDKWGINAEKLGLTRKKSLGDTTQLAAIQNEKGLRGSSQAVDSGVSSGMAYRSPTLEKMTVIGDEPLRRRTSYFAFTESAAEQGRSFYDDDALSVGFDIKSAGEQYAPIHENAFVNASGGDAISTFSIDVDTASYANMRRFLNSGQAPPRDSIRIEELVNYFQYDYPQPQGDDPFSVNMELASCPWNDAHQLLRIGLKGKDVHVQERPATNVVYLIDVSGSMNSPDKLPLLKRGFQMMTKQLGENDRVSIVTYAGNAGVVLEPTTGDNTKTINDAIERLTPGGSTHGSAGIELAYKLAQQHFITGGVNKVILATDGDLNVGVTADGALVDLIKQKASEGVFLTVLGFGTGNLQDGKLEKLADNGNGHYAYLDTNREAHRVLVQQMSGSLVTIAKDVKIQIEFNPAEVKSYRLVGYENRMLATKDFDDDRKDAGEIGAGHTVTAIYEIEPTGGAAEAFVAPQEMKYQTVVKDAEDQKRDDVKARGLSEAANSGELATVALRYKKPDENESKRIEFAIQNDEKSFSSATDDFRFAASVAGFGMLLRGSQHAGAANPKMILDIASGSIGYDATGYRAEFVDLVRKAFSAQ